MKVLSLLMVAFLSIGTEALAIESKMSIYEVRDNIEKDMMMGYANKAYTDSKRECAKENMFACELSAEIVSGGYGVAPDLNEAKRQNKKACKLGSYDACEKIKTKVDVGVMNELMKIASEECEKDMAGSCEFFGIRTFYGSGVKQNKTEGMRLLIKSCALGYSRACSEVSANYLVGNSEFDMKSKADDFLELACYTGDVVQCYKLGQKSSASGSGMSSKKTVDYFERACFGGLGKGCVDLAKMTSLGMGTKRNPELAVELIIKACGLGEEKACLSKKDDILVTKKGFDVIKKKCEAGDSAKCETMVAVLEDEIKEKKEMLKWFAQMSCEYGVGTECSTLGKKFENNFFGVKNLKKAEESYKKGCYRGDSKSCGALKDVVKVFSVGCDKGVRRDCLFLQKYYLTGKMGFGGDTETVREKIDLKRSIKMASNLCIGGGEDACDDIKEWDFHQWKEVEKVLVLQELYEKARQLGLDNMLVDVLLNPPVVENEGYTLKDEERQEGLVFDVGNTIEELIFGDEDKIQTEEKIANEPKKVEKVKEEKKPFVKRYISQFNHSTILYGLALMSMVATVLLILRIRKKKQKN